MVNQDGSPQIGFMVRHFPSVASLILEVLLLNRVWKTNPEARANAQAGAVGTFRDKAFDLMTSRQAKEAFNIHAEADKNVSAFAASGRFAPPLTVASSADLQSRMLALFGRRA